MNANGKMNMVFCPQSPNNLVHQSHHRLNSKVPGIDPKRNTKLVNLTEFSGYLAESNRTENSSANYSTMSMGQFFAKRCEDVRDMIPSRSPTKSKPIALVGDSYRSASDYNTSSESNKYSQGRVAHWMRSFSIFSRYFPYSIIIILHRRRIEN